jgi:hypothetical protein
MVLLMPAFDCLVEFLRVAGCVSGSIPIPIPSQPTYHLQIPEILLNPRSIFGGVTWIHPVRWRDLVAVRAHLSRLRIVFFFIFFTLFFVFFVLLYCSCVVYMYVVVFYTYFTLIHNTPCCRVTTIVKFNCGATSSWMQISHPAQLSTQCPCDVLHWVLHKVGAGWRNAVRHPVAPAQRQARIPASQCTSCYGR